MKSISLTVLCGLGLIFGLAFFGLAAESEAAASLQATETTQPSATTQPLETTQPPSGGIDPAILGNWIDETTSSATRYYTFNSDGTFKYLEFEGSHASSTEGKYTTSNGKVYFTELVSSLSLKYADRVFEYGFRKTSSGELCLLIGTMANNDGERWLDIELDRAVEFTKL
jgi:hypothetical protein